MSTKTKRGRGSARTTDADRVRMLKALSHPLRQRILLALNEREASPSQLADRLGVRLTNLSYHFKVLVEQDAIELVKTEQVRGTVKHFYRATERPVLGDELWGELPAPTRRTLFGLTLDEIWKNVNQAAIDGGLDDAKTHISWVNLDLDEEGYREIVDLTSETLDRAMEIQAEVANRRADGEGGRERHATQLTLMHFHRGKPR